MPNPESDNVESPPGGILPRLVDADGIVNTWLESVDYDDDEDCDEGGMCDCSLCRGEEVEPERALNFEPGMTNFEPLGVPQSIEHSYGYEQLNNQYSSIFGASVNAAVRCAYCRDIVQRKNVKEISGLMLCPECAAKYKLACKVCGSKVRYRNPKNFMYFQGIFYCKKCCETCTHCSTEKPSQHFKNADGKRFCLECFRLRYFVCADCNTVSKIEMAISAGGEGGYSICETCYEENYFTCIECDNIFSNSSYTRDGMCFQCARRTGHVHTCDYKPTSCFHGTRKHLMMGMELEVEKKRGGNDIFECANSLYNMSDNEQDFYLKEDGSLNNGIEIVSHPMTLDFHKKFYWKKVFNECVSQGFNSHNTSTCGLHVHVSRSFFTFLDCIRMGMFVAFHKDKFETLSRRTENDDYAKFKHVGKGDLRSASRNDDNRYEAVNWTNAKTIEFRMFRGTLLYETFIATLELVDAVSHFVKTVNTNQVYGVPNGKSSAWDLFCKFISRDRKTYKILINYMIEKGVYTCA